MARRDGLPHHVDRRRRAAVRRRSSVRRRVVPRARPGSDKAPPSVRALALEVHLRWSCFGNARRARRARRGETVVVSATIRRRFERKRCLTVTIKAGRRGRLWRSRLLSLSLLLSHFRFFSFVFASSLSFLVLRSHFRSSLSFSIFPLIFDLPSREVRCVTRGRANAFLRARAKLAAEARLRACARAGTSVRSP